MLDQHKTSGERQPDKHDAFAELMKPGACIDAAHVHASCEHFVLCLCDDQNLA